jgi:signal transduction histidine kinase
MSSASCRQRVHDIRNSLNVIMGNAQLLQASSPLTREQQKCTHRIVSAAREVLAMLNNDFIDAARSDLKEKSCVAEKGNPDL